MFLPKVKKYAKGIVPAKAIEEEEVVYCIVRWSVRQSVMYLCCNSGCVYGCVWWCIFDVFVCGVECTSVCLLLLSFYSLLLLIVSLWSNLYFWLTIWSFIWFFVQLICILIYFSICYHICGTDLLASWFKLLIELPDSYFLFSFLIYIADLAFRFVEDG